MLKIIVTLLLPCLAYSQVEIAKPAIQKVVEVKNKAIQEASLACINKICTGDIKPMNEFTNKFIESNPSEMKRLREYASSKEKFVSDLLSSVAQSEHASDKAKEYIKLLIENQKKNKENIIKDAEAMCQAHLAYQAYNTPTSKEIITFDSLLKGYVNEYFNSLEKVTSKKSAKILKKKVLSQVKKSKFVNGNMSIEKLFSQERPIKTEKEIEEVNNKNIKVVIEAAESAVKSNSSFTDEASLYRDSLALIGCDNPEHSGVTDHYRIPYIKDKKLLGVYLGQDISNPVFGFSERTIKEGPKAKFVIFHELSHYIYFAVLYKKNGLSSNSINRVSSIAHCLSNELSDTKNLAYLEGHYIKEDFADVIAAKFTPGETGVPIFCKAMSNANSFYSLPEFLSLENENKEDTHSSMLYRLIKIEQTRKGKIPKACTEAIKLQPDNSRTKDLFKSCKIEK